MDTQSLRNPGGSVYSSIPDSTAQGQRGRETERELQPFRQQMSIVNAVLSVLPLIEVPSKQRTGTIQGSY